MEYYIEPNKDTVKYRGAVVLSSLQKAVAGYIEIVYLRNSIMIVNEEGYVKNLEYNQVASDIARMPIYGNAVWLTEESRGKLK